uniref:Uncharacterized protein n=1 Tax=Physcomitrium patens TaxID=3218 RepID=A0A2K1KKE5_PHYPA|nr:hypothetical protein PHYPA_007919 [Physcomitrium patens]
MSNFVFSHLICDGRLRVDSNLRLERKAQHIFAAGSVFNKLYDDPSLLGVRNTCCVVVFHLKKPPCSSKSSLESSFRCARCCVERNK